MKIISLNVWHGKQKDELRKFLEDEIPTTDIFCLQETYDEFRNEFDVLFEDFNEVYEYCSGFTEGESVEAYVLTTYIKKTLKITESKILFCEPKENGNVYGAGVHVTIDVDGVPLHILNYHGVSRPKDKLDTLERIEQSNKIAAYYEGTASPKILIGDFNFLPTTQSYEIIKSTNYSELILEHRIPTTRNELYWDRRGLDHKYSDYCFISSEIHVQSLEVPQITVSDHLPLIFRFDVV